jgi:hypothetical protein
MTYVLIHVPRNVRDVQVGVLLVGELLEFGIEGFLSKVSNVQNNDSHERTLAKLTS